MRENGVFSKVVFIAAIGYFVDIYDLVLFGVVRVASLKELGFSGDDLLSKGLALVNAQTAGLLIGGILWGVLGDKVGRVRALFGSILLFSLATFVNAFVHSLPVYILCRFITGIGLAGELGIGVTLMVESMPKHLRGYGTTAIIVLGVFGAVFASFITDFFNWRTTYIVGGVLGLSLLIFRSGLSESQVFIHTRETMHGKLNLLPLLKSKDTLLKYIRCILIGVPSQFVPGILVIFSPELMATRNLDQPIKIGTAIIMSYTGTALGAAISGVIVQKIKSRKNTIIGFLLFALVAILSYLLLPYQSIAVFYLMCGLMGAGIGFWSVGVLMCAEQFGTNVRSTATTTISNFSRAGLLILTVLFGTLAHVIGPTETAAILGVGVVGLAFFGVIGLKDTFDKDVDYLET
jgi:putative MFS transporter